MLIFTDPIATKDSYDPWGGYLGVAECLHSFDFSDYNGGRTPGYPFIIALTGINYNIVVIIQMLMGVVISIILYQLMFNLIGNHVISFFSGLSYTLYLPFLNREILIATETTAIFFITLSFYFLVKFLQKLKNKEINYTFLILALVTTAYTALTRPLYILNYYFVFIAILITLLIFRFTFKRIVITAIIMILPNLVFIQGWSYVNKQLIDNYCLSPWTSLNLSNKIGLYMEDAPDEYATIKEIYIKHRDKKIEETGTHIVTMWHAFKDIKEATGLSNNELYDKIMELNINTIRANPEKYLNSLPVDWIIFWKPLGMAVPVSKFIDRIRYLQDKGMRLIILIFFLFPVIYLFIPHLRKKYPLTFEQWIISILFYTLVFSCSIACAVLEPGNQRFSVVTDPLMVLLVIMLIYQVLWPSVLDSITKMLATKKKY